MIPQARTPCTSESTLRTVASPTDAVTAELVGELGDHCGRDAPQLVLAEFREHVLVPRSGVADERRPVGRLEPRGPDKFFAGHGWDKDRVVSRDPPKRVAVSQLGASVRGVSRSRKLVCQPQNGSGEKRLSISIILSAPLPFALPAIIWSSPVGLGLETM